MKDISRSPLTRKTFLKKAGLGACAPALLSTDGMRENKIIQWNPETMRVG